jgi:hypothetical protein
MMELVIVIENVSDVILESQIKFAVADLLKKLDCLGNTVKVLRVSGKVDVNI